MPLSAIHILLVEDSAADVRLISEALRDSTLVNRVTVAKDGLDALAVLHREGAHAAVTRPDLILLDLNLPKRSGRTVLAEIKQDPNLKCIPVVVLTSSSAEDDILQSYNLHANCCITKPMELANFMKMVKAVESFWAGTVRLPPK